MHSKTGMDVRMATIGLIDMDGEGDVVEEDILGDDVRDIAAPTSAPCGRRAVHGAGPALEVHA